MLFLNKSDSTSRTEKSKLVDSQNMTEDGVKPAASVQRQSAGTADGMEKTTPAAAQAQKQQRERSADRSGGMTDSLGRPIPNDTNSLRPAGGQHPVLDHHRTPDPVSKCSKSDLHAPPINIVDPISCPPRA